MKVKLSKIDISPLLADGIWLGSKLEIYIDVDIIKTITVERVYERDRVKTYNLLKDICKFECAENISDSISKEIANKVNAIDRGDHKTIYEVLRLKLPTFLSHAANGKLCLYDFDNDKMVVIDLGIDSHGKYDSGSVDFNEWPWCNPSLSDLDVIDKELKERDLMSKSILGG